MRPFVNRLILVIGFALATTVAHADFSGSELSQDYSYPTAGSPYLGYNSTNPTFIVPFYGEFGVIEGVTTIDADVSSAIITITLETSLNNPTWGSAAFNGLVITTISPSTLNISGFSVLPGTTMSGFDDTRVSVTANSIGINWQGLSYASGTTVSIGFTFDDSHNAVPEPASIALFVAGLLGAWRAKRKRASEATPHVV